MKTWRGAGPRRMGEPGVRAERLRLRPWTDPRLLLGVLLVLVATLLGARLAAAVDDREAYWAVDASVRAGDAVSRSHLTQVRVRLDDTTAGRYLRIDDELPGAIAELQWARDLGDGTLVQAADLVPRSTAASRQLPVAVADGAAPDDLARGDLVEVWVGAAPGDQAPRKARKVLEVARVLRIGGTSGSLEGAGGRSVLLEVAPEALRGEVVSWVAAGHVTLVRVP